MSHVAAQTASPTDGKKANETTTPNVLPPMSQQQTFTLPSSPSSPPSFKLPPDLDLTRPISQLLREGTADVHTAVEDSEGAQLLTKGQLGNREYTRVLFMLWHIYDELERGLYEHREHPVLYHIYHPRVFSRASALSFDICHHLGTVTWQTDPFYVSFYNNIPKPVQAYIDRLSYLGRSEATSEEVSCLAAHAYVRYLGDLSGGQMIRRKLIKSYGLYEDGEGSAFYNFRTLDYRTGDRPAEMHEIRKIKAWFKEGLDEAVTDPKLKGVLFVCFFASVATPLPSLSFPFQNGTCPFHFYYFHMVTNSPYFTLLVLPTSIPSPSCIGSSAIINTILTSAPLFTTSHRTRHRRSTCCFPLQWGSVLLHRHHANARERE
ncbi:uncharacterized protein EI90DRAFT_1857188 [Cantharellus anzutake]|uniref:uncharacterized protein n=1 Tax=Cantharellus anzutake TaxID=1750568 RepID=UPI0019069E18|nr:uncharacterized protein EI90DRAFT_1857188 [Cantharellus anzutake]KAF8327007.1 hypothetical protein EI90DRAFT_1857188 [Cantharellus anzutake]